MPSKEPVFSDLDTYASRVSPPDDFTDSFLQERHSLRTRAGNLLESERLQGCGRKRTGPTVEMWRGCNGATHFRGVETCGSIWLCPVCSSKIAHKRSIEVQALADAHEKAGGAVYMATFTMRHHLFNRVADLKSTITKAWQKMQSGAPWGRLKNEHGISHAVRALEVTHGGNGWHPHLHVLLLTKKTLDDTEMELMKLDLFERWAAKIKSLKGTTEIGAFDLRKASSGIEAASYIAKWGAGHEIAKGAGKSASGRSVWDLLKASEFDPEAGRLFKEYAEAFKGARHLTYSKGSREAYDLRDPETDLELAIEGTTGGEKTDKETGEVTTAETGRIWMADSGTWNKCVKLKIIPLLLEAGREDGSEGIERVLERYDCYSYFDAKEHPAPAYKPPPEPRRRAFDPAGIFTSFKSAMEVEIG